MRRGLGHLRAQNRELFDSLDEIDDWHFSWRLTAPDAIEPGAELIWQCAQAWSTWSPILLDFHIQANVDEEEEQELIYDAKDPIRRRRSQCQCMSVAQIHDVDKPRHADDTDVSDEYGRSCVRAFLSLSEIGSKVGMVLTAQRAGRVAKQYPIKATTG